MKNSQKGSTVVVLLIIIIVILLGVIGYSYFKPTSQNQQVQNSAVNSQPVVQEEQNVPAPLTNRVKESVPVKNTVTTNNNASSNNCGLNITSISPNTKVSFPVTISGTVNNSTGCHWSMFEGQAGTAQLYFNYQNEGWKTLGVGIPVKVSDWTANNTQFSVTLNFNNDGIGLPSGTPLKIVFSAENASGLPANEKTLEFPIILK